ncbi:hypothetical protein PFICI_00640 [Pestalotiopsis fici W106-1]|uniref:Kinesin-like protein n=1 Tax=Pestalotiopsis fici (strain W106-1 / CGMCC3.15140) TaxID=1229662 RepID=W3XMS7_PESFW|nr:uncharacterized protein PFICI_00640 [Pestalotiopsis fici W106-1]ETS86812.1 hypothetical protein PFICI_00640 [Pestalotiopsis fici W106-1]
MSTPHPQQPRRRGSSTQRSTPPLSKSSESHARFNKSTTQSTEQLPRCLHDAIGLHGRTIAKEINAEIQTLVNLMQHTGISQGVSQVEGPVDIASQEPSSSDTQELVKLYSTAQDRIKHLETMLETEKARSRELTKEKDDMLASHHRDYHELRVNNKISMLNEQKLLQQFEEEQERCRRLFDHIQELKGGIRVMCRIRPSLPHEAKMEVADFGPPERGSLTNYWAKLLLPIQRTRVTGEATTETKEYNFERIFGPGDGNDAVFGEINDLVQCALQGGKATIFCYGQSGSGKTFTMSHQEDLDNVDSQDGIMPQALAMLFRSAEEQADKCKYEFYFSAVEIYKETMFDLESVDDEGRIYKVPGNDPGLATKFLVTKLKGVLGDHGVLKQIRDKRVVSSTKLNEQSSRSHLILSCYVKRTLLRGRHVGTISEGVLNLVDLAGSERVGQAGTEGSQLQEGIAINQSLLSLTMAIASLGEGKQPTPSTILTRFLNPCFTSDCKVLMLVNVSPLKRDMPVTLQTLQRASEASKARLVEVKRTQKQRAAAAAAAATASAKTPSASTVTRSAPNKASKDSASSASTTSKARTATHTPAKDASSTHALRRSPAKSTLRSQGSSSSQSSRSAPSRK